jgi:hypothetical protein
VEGLAASGLLSGQSREFFAAATALAKAADAGDPKLAFADPAEQIGSTD